MDQELTRYLNEHLAGSIGALLLIEKLAKSHDQAEAREFFRLLVKEVETDRCLLEDLLEKLGKEPGNFLRIAGGIAARVAGVKSMWEQVEPGKLGLFEALEMLSLGVQGKRLLWVSLIEIAGWIPEWEGIDFGSLELQAIRQRDDIEFWRLQAAVTIMVAGERRYDIEALNLHC